MITWPRLFVAAPLDGAARAAVADIVATVRAAVKPEREVRWVRLDGLHVTLRFVGPTDGDRIVRIEEAAEATARDVAAFSVTLEGAGAFPAQGRPRAIWIGLTDGAEALQQLAVNLDDELADRGWPRSERPFRPHLTLARSDGVAAGAATVAALSEAVAGRTVTSRIDRIVVFETITGGGPARYIERASAPLG